MRRRDREMTDEAEMIDLLTRASVGRLGTVDGDGFPVIKPLNFVWWKDGIYFHTAVQGEKIRHLDGDDRVGFEVDEPLGYVPAGEKACDAGYHFRSLIVRGRARHVLDPEEKRAALKALMDKYQPDGGYGPFSEVLLEKTGVVRIDVVSLTGKKLL